MDIFFYSWWFFLIRKNNKKKVKTGKKLAKKRKADTSFYRKFLTIYVALCTAECGNSLSVNLADNMMLGSYSERALSGEAAVNQIQFIYQQPLMALGDALFSAASTGESGRRNQ